MVGPGVIVTNCRKCGSGECIVPPIVQTDLSHLRAHLRRCPTCGRGGRRVGMLLPGPPTQPEAAEVWQEAIETDWEDEMWGDRGP